MKVLHINRNYITSSLHQVMMNHFDRSEGEIRHSVFVPAGYKETAFITPNSNVFVSRCFGKWDSLFFDLKQHKIMAALDRHFDVRQFDCIHAYTLFTDGNAAMKLSEKYGLPYIVAVRNTDVNDFFKKIPFLRNRGVQVLKKASAICFLSESYKNTVFKQYVPESLQEELKAKSHIIPNGIDNFWFENRFERERLPHQPLRLMYAGRIDANKNIEGIMNAMSILRENGIESRLDVVGKIYDQKVSKNIFQNNYVHYHEAVPKEQLINYYRQSDIFVMPSFTESFGLVYVEAMSQGLPVVYSKGEGFDKQFAEGEVGYHVDPKDSKEIAAAIAKILKRYQEISESVAMRSVRYNWDDICLKYKMLYKKICGT